MPPPMVHIPEAEAIRDFTLVLKHIDEGAEVIIDRGEGKRSLSIRSRSRLIEEAMEIAKSFEPVTLDPAFADDLEEVIRSHRPEVYPVGNRT